MREVLGSIPGTALFISPHNISALATMTYRWKNVYLLSINMTKMCGFGLCGLGGCFFGVLVGLGVA